MKIIEKKQLQTEKKYCMALMICPECGQQVSDKAEFCPHCGIKIAGNIVPAQNTPDVAHKEPVSVAQKQKKGGKSIKLLAASFMIAVAICGTAYYFYSKAQEAKEMEDYTYAMQSTDPMVMQMYLSRYADAPREHRDSVNTHLAALSQADNDWNNAMVSGTRNALEEYVKNHPTSSHCGEAKNKIDSIDFAIASRENTVAAFSKYLKQHPDGKYAEQAQDFVNEKKMTEAQPEEVMLAKMVCKHFFQAINARNTAKLLETVTEYLSDFLNRKGATSNDVVTFMDKLYKEDVTNLNWHILDDFTVDKVKNSDGNYNIRAQFGAELDMERTDPAKEKKGRYFVTCEITPEGKITKLNMKKTGSQ